VRHERNEREVSERGLQKERNKSGRHEINERQMSERGLQKEE
jgi:hypothetical protein